MPYLLNKLEQEYCYLKREELDGAILAKRVRALEDRVEKLEEKLSQTSLFSAIHCSSTYASPYSNAHSHYDPYSMGALQNAMGNAVYRAQLEEQCRRNSSGLFGRMFW